MSTSSSSTRSYLAAARLASRPWTRGSTWSWSRHGRLALASFTSTTGRGLASRPSPPALVDRVSLTPTKEELDERPYPLCPRLTDGGAVRRERQEARGGR